MNNCHDRILGCIAGSYAGSAMGAAVEGWPHDSISSRYGILEEMLEYAHYSKNDRGGGRLRLPGTTEDGIERQKLMCTAIFEKPGRITPEDLARVWVRDINPDNFGVQMQPTDITMYRLMVAGQGFEVAGYQRIGHYSHFPAAEVGRFTVAPGTVAFARSCHPIGVINAFDPRQAAQDAIELGKMYVPSNDVALFWAAAVAAGIAEAMDPDADVSSVLQAARSVVPRQIWDEIELGLQLTGDFTDPIEMRVAFDARYNNTAGFNPMSKAHEIVTKAFAIFSKTAGNTRDAVVAAVNFGRDTDCLAAIVGGLSGALTGTAHVPPQWIDTIDKATAANDYTVSKVPLGETATGLHKALLHELAGQRTRIDKLAALSGERI